MDIHFHIEKRHLYILCFVLVLVSCLVFVKGYGGDEPKVFGHSANELHVGMDYDDGNFENHLVGNLLRTKVCRKNGINCPVPDIDTGSLDGTLKNSPEEIALVENNNCIKLNNEDYSSNQWMSCPRGYYVSAVTDNIGQYQDVFCCPF